MSTFTRLHEDLNKYAMATNVPITLGGKVVIADRVVKTACPHNCYDTCGFLAYIKDEKVIKVAGDPDHPITRGHLCLKGYANVQKINSPDRVKYPMLRVGERGEGKFKRISWDEAFDWMTEKMTMLRDTYGPASFCEYLYSGNREHMIKAASSRFHNLFGSSKLVGSFCLLSGAAGSYYSIGEQNVMSPEVWMDKTDCVFLIGRNPSFTNPHLYPFLYRAMDRGAKLIVVDPYLTPVGSKADIHLRPRPTTVLQMIMGMTNYIVNNNLHDKDFIAQHCFGFDEFMEEVNKMPVERAAQICDMDVEQLKQAAIMYATHKTQTECGYGHQRYSNGHQTQRAVSCMAAVCGHIGKETGNLNFINHMGFPSLPGFMNAAKVAAPEGATIPKTRLINISTFAQAVLAAKDPPIKGCICYRGGLVSQQPYVAETLKAVKQLDMFVVIEQFMTDDTDYADLVLPGCHFLEQYGFHPSYWHSFFQVLVPVCQPYHEAVPDIEIWQELGRRLGFEEYFPKEDTGLDYIRWMLPDDVKLEECTSPRGPIRIPERWCPRVPYADYKFKTPSGKFEFYSLGMVERGKKFPGDWKPVPWNMDTDESPTATPELFAKYPFTLISQHPAFRTHSQGYNLPWIKEIEGPPKVFINHADANALGLKAGDKVRIANDRGELLNVLAAPTVRVRKGVAELSSGMWVKLGASVNVLTSQSVGGPRDVGVGIMEEYHPLMDGNTTAYFNTLVKIEKMQEGVN